MSRNCGRCERYVTACVCANTYDTYDHNDALVIAEAAERAVMRLVAVKTVELQNVQTLHRRRPDD